MKKKKNKEKLEKSSINFSNLYYDEHEFMADFSCLKCDFCRNLCEKSKAKKCF